MPIIEPMGQINRREFLKLLTKIPEVTAAGIAATAVATKAKDEADVVQTGMFENDGVLYQPIYEVHNYGPGTDLNLKANGVFIEINTQDIGEDGAVIGNHYTVNPDDILGAINADIPEIYDYYQEVAKRRIPVAIGDIALPQKFAKETDLKKESSDSDNRDFYTGLSVAIAGLALSTGTAMGSEKITRRGFLKKIASLGLAASVFGMWKASGTVNFRDLTLAKATDDLSNQYEPVNRLLIRLNGLASDVHPESPSIFIRNILMARKMKLFGEYLKSKGIEKPIEGYSVGAGHSGIEDFICLPDAVTKSLIKYCARDYVNRALSNYGDFVSAVRIVQADETGIFKDVEMLYDTELLNELDQD